MYTPKYISRSSRRRIISESREYLSATYHTYAFSSRYAKHRRQKRAVTRLSGEETKYPTIDWTKCARVEIRPHLQHWLNPLAVRSGRFACYSISRISRTSRSVRTTRNLIGPTALPHLARATSYRRRCVRRCRSGRIIPSDIEETMEFPPAGILAPAEEFPGGPKKSGSRHTAREWSAHSVKSTEVVSKLLTGVPNSSAKKPTKLTPTRERYLQAESRCGSADRAASSEVPYPRERTYIRTYTAGLIRQLPAWTSRMFSLGFYPKYSESRAHPARKPTANRRFLRNPKVTDAPPKLSDRSISISPRDSRESLVLTAELEHWQIIRSHVQTCTRTRSQENQCPAIPARRSRVNTKAVYPPLISLSEQMDKTFNPKLEAQLNCATLQLKQCIFS